MPYKLVKLSKNDVKRYEIYVNSSKRSLSQIKTALGCDYIMNAGLFDMTTFKPVSGLTVGCCTMYKSDVYGIAFRNGEAVFSYANNVMAPYWIGAYPCLIRNGKQDFTSIPYGLGGQRGRSAIGLTKDGEFVMFCAPDMADTSDYSMYELTKILMEAGCVAAINLDGGGSSQCDFLGDKITSSRVVHNFICVWLTDEARKRLTGNKTTPAISGDKTGDKTNDVPPAFPGSTYFKQGLSNEYIEWLGKMLIKAGYGSYYKVGASKSWGEADKNACEAFQLDQGWRGSDADGYPGKGTWTRLVALWGAVDANTEVPVDSSVNKTPTYSVPSVVLPQNYAEKGVNSRSEDDLLPYVKYLWQQLKKYCAEEGIDIILTGTVRDATYQQYCKDNGSSSTAAIGAHAFGRAFDVCINSKADAYNAKTFKRIGEIGKMLGLEWGGDWTSFPDEPHFQYVQGLTNAQLRAGVRKIMPTVPKE